MVKDSSLDYTHPRLHDHCKLGAKNYDMRLPESPAYTREQFFNDVINANNKGQIIEAMSKTLSGSRFKSQMPLEVWNKIKKQS